jgi:hypothetical protein
VGTKTIEMIAKLTGLKDDDANYGKPYIMGM